MLLRDLGERNISSGVLIEKSEVAKAGLNRAARINVLLYITFSCCYCYNTCVAHISMYPG